jgi:hypothetical protein
MEAHYYYFAATLPMISFESKLPFSLEDFLQDCRRLLKENDSRLIDELLTQDVYQTGSPSMIFNRWAAFFLAFKNELAWFRAQNAGKDPLNFIRGDRAPQAAFVDVLQQAQKAENPLEGQKVIDRFLWNFLDELEIGHDFDLGKILIYGLKLKILERYARIDSPVGERMFEELEETQIPLSFAHQI